MRRIFIFLLLIVVISGCTDNGSQEIEVEEDPEVQKKPIEKKPDPKSVVADANSSYASQYSQLYEYPRQTQELCEAGGAEWFYFSTGCHDECVYARWSADDRYACTEALSYGCECGPDKCWNGIACEPNFAFNKERP